jgi:hypothetical protein
MNIFFLDKNPKTCAKYHVNKHCVKMIVELSQILSTCHRVLDGTKIETKSVKGRKQTVYKLSCPISDPLLYKATHINHPSTVWARSSLANYLWTAHLLHELCTEYTYRYGKIHKCQKIGLVKHFVGNIPTNIETKPFTEPTCAMPTEYMVSNDSLTSYRNYYRIGKKHLHQWKDRPVPDFILEN